MRSILKHKKGSLDLLVPAILTLVIAAAVLTFGLIITQALRDTAATGTTAWDAANKTVVGLGTFADYWEIIVLAIVITIVISLLLVIFAARGKAR